MISSLRRWWNGETDGVAAAAFLIGALSLVSRLVGLLRDRALAATFGAGPSLDAYYAAFRLPDLLYNLLILGALSAGFIPIFSEYLERKGKEQAMRLAEKLFSVIAVSMMVACALLFLTAPWFVRWLAPGFEGEQLALTIRLTQIMSLSPLFLGLSAVFGGVLQATRRFFAFSAAPVFYNLGILFGIFALAPFWGIVGVAWGVVIGAFLHFVVQARVAMKLGFNKVSKPEWKDEGVLTVLRMMGPRTIGLAFSQLTLLVVLNLASSLPAGSIAVFNLATNIQSVPLGLFGISFAIAAFPALSRAAAGKRTEEYQDALGSAGRKIVFFILPITALFLLMRAQIVRVLLGQGHFDWGDTIRTADVLGILALSLVGQSLIPLLTRAFYAVQDAKTPVIIGAVCEVITIALAWSLRDFYGIVGLAIATTLATGIQLVCLWLALRKIQGPLGQGQFILSAWKTLIGTIGFCVVAFPIREWLGTIFPLRTVWQVVLQLAIPSLAGGIVFFLLTWLLKSPELAEFFDALKRKLWKRVELSESVDTSTVQPD